MLLSKEDFSPLPDSLQTIETTFISMGECSHFFLPYDRFGLYQDSATLAQVIE